MGQHPTLSPASDDSGFMQAYSAGCEREATNPTLYQSMAGSVFGLQLSATHAREKLTFYRATGTLLSLTSCRTTFQVDKLSKSALAGWRSPQALADERALLAVLAALTGPGSGSARYAARESASHQSSRAHSGRTRGRAASLSRNARPWRRLYARHRLARRQSLAGSCRAWTVRSCGLAWQNEQMVAPTPDANHGDERNTCRSEHQAASGGPSERTHPQLE